MCCVRAPYADDIAAIFPGVILICTPAIWLLRSCFVGIDSGGQRPCYAEVRMADPSLKRMDPELDAVPHLLSTLNLALI